MNTLTVVHTQTHTHFDCFASDGFVSGCELSREKTSPPLPSLALLGLLDPLTVAIKCIYLQVKR